jgi:hypothetical protein
MPEVISRQSAGDYFIISSNKLFNNRALSLLFQLLIIPGAKR